MAKPPPLPTLPLFSSGPLTDDPPPPDLRKYQQTAITKLRNFVRAGKRRILLVSPCASGKMFLVAAVIRTSTVPCLFVAHRRELIDQCVRELARQRVRHVGVIRGDDERSDPTAPVQVASIDTLSHRPLSVAPGLIFLDEAHRMTETIEREIFERYPNAIIIGLTGSPERLDRKALGSRYEDLYEVTTYSELFRQKFLYPPDLFSAPLKPDLSRLTLGGADYDEAELGEELSKRELTGQLVEHYLAHAHVHYRFDDDGHVIHGSGASGPRRPAIGFASSIPHSLAVVERFQAAGVRAEHLDGSSPDERRRSVLAGLRDGRVEIVWNVNLLLEGIDIPEVKLIVHARPTLSLVLWMQSCNRALRRWPLVGDPIRPLILDHAGNYDRHGSPCVDREWSLTIASRRKGERLSLKICGGCFAYVAGDKILCPYCGWEFPEHLRDVKPPRETREKLERRTETEKPDAKRAYFDGRLATARARGFKPGWVSFAFKKKYDEWPPWAWSDDVKASYASDADWQRAVEQRQAEAKHWNEKRVEKEAAVDQKPDDETEAVVQDQEESFGDWWGRQ